MSYQCFFSYARKDYSATLHRFVDDLGAEMRLLAFLEEHQCVFFDADRIETGQLWKDALAKALRTSRVFVALCTPDYLKSEYCGKEFQVFLERYHSYVQQNKLIELPNLIIPVLWGPPGSWLKDCPVVTQFQYTDSRFPAVYAKRGLRHLMQLTAQTDDYVKFVAHLAETIVNAGAAHMLDDLEQVRAFETIESAFQQGGGIVASGGSKTSRVAGVTRSGERARIVEDKNVPWLVRFNEFVGAAGNRLRRPLWPVSFGACAGLDRGRQVTICVGVDEQLLLAELQRVEDVLASQDSAERFGRRRWSLADTRSTPTTTEGVICTIVPEAASRASRDTIEGLVEDHFRRFAACPSAAMVLSFPMSAGAEARHWADVLRKSRTISELDVVVDQLQLGESEWNAASMSPFEAERLELIEAFGTGSRTDQLPMTGNSMASNHALMAWLDGSISDDEYFANAEGEDIRLAVLGGRFGRNGEHPELNAERRSVALIRAAATARNLLWAIGSLPVTENVVKALVDAPPVVRAVAGLVTPAETSMTPSPWFNVDIGNWRHRQLAT